jgi:hypothetical protein
MQSPDSHQSTGTRVSSPMMARSGRQCRITAWREGGGAGRAGAPFAGAPFAGDGAARRGSPGCVAGGAACCREALAGLAGDESGRRKSPVGMARGGPGRHGCPGGAAGGGAWCREEPPGATEGGAGRGRKPDSGPAALAAGPAGCLGLKRGRGGNGRGGSRPARGPVTGAYGRSSGTGSAVVSGGCLQPAGSSVRRFFGKLTPRTRVAGQPPLPLFNHSKPKMPQISSSASTSRQT